MAKKWYKSRTMWTNAIIAAAGVVIGTMENAGGYLATVAGMVNILLRTVTREPIE